MVVAPTKLRRQPNHVTYRRAEALEDGTDANGKSGKALVTVDGKSIDIFCCDVS